MNNRSAQSKSKRDHRRDTSKHLDRVPTVCPAPASHYDLVLKGFIEVVEK
jgi:hypothetical protein